MEPVPATVRVVLCDDHPVMRESLAMALDRDERFTVVGQATTGAEMLELLEGCDADVVVLDMMMAPMGGIEASRRLRERCPDVKVLVLSASGEPQLVREALDAGAGGYLLKTTHVGELKDAMVQVSRGMVVLDGAIDMRGGSGSLSQRQLDILEMLAQGRSRAEIADELIISVNTVKSHINNLYAALGVSSALEAVAKAREMGWLSSAAAQAGAREQG